jgi:DNA segregation ATPase FtsK/SpoIIIE, S-DNA-T family
MPAKCLFPDHHSAGGKPGKLVLVLAAVVGLVLVKLWPVVVGVFHVITAICHFAAVAFPFAAWSLAALTVAWIVRGVIRFARAPREVKANYPLACLARFRWRWLCRNLGLAYDDKHRKAARPVAFGTAAKIRTDETKPVKVRFPRAKIRPITHGIEASVRTVPSVGRLEFEKAAEHIANQWRCQRVSVTQPVSGRLVVRGLRVDPLFAPLSVRDAPEGTYDGTDLSRLWVGRDEHGQHRYMTVKENIAATVAGLPGSGKSNGINGLLLQWASSPACQFGTADGKSPLDGGDYAVWRDRAWRTVSDSREDVADMLSDACRIMRDRQGCARDFNDGDPDMWHKGPSPEWPLFGLVLDECARFLALGPHAKTSEVGKLILQIQDMTWRLASQGRSTLMFIVVATQKATGDAIPPAIRDLAALSLALAQRTDASAVAALGEDIRDFPTFSPTLLQGDEHIGCATANLRTGKDPFTRLRMPEVTRADLAACAKATAHLRRDPAVLPVVAVPDDARELLDAEEK